MRSLPTGLLNDHFVEEFSREKKNAHLVPCQQKRKAIKC